MWKRWVEASDLPPVWLLKGRLRKRENAKGRVCSGEEKLDKRPGRPESRDE